VQRHLKSIKKKKEPTESTIEYELDKENSNCFELKPRKTLKTSEIALKEQIVNNFLNPSSKLKQPDFLQ